MKKKLIAAIISCIVASTLIAQQIPLSSSTYFMRLTYNPALTGYNGSTNAYGYYRNQWTGMPGHPITMGGMGEISLWKDQSNIGFHVYNDVTSIISNVGAQLYYAQKIQLAKDHHLSVGVSIGILNTHVDYNNAVYNDVNDPNVFTVNKAGLGFDMNAGIAYQWKKLTIGFAVPHIAQTNVVLADQVKGSNYNALRHYVAHASYEFSFKQEKWNLEPSILFKKGSSKPFQIEGNVMANYNRFIYLGVGYRQDYGMSFTGAVRIARCVTLGYTYEYPIMSSVTFGNTKGTHEIIMGINFDKWIKNPELKKLKKRVDTMQQHMDSLQLRVQKAEENDSAMAKRIDSLEQTDMRLDKEAEEAKQAQKVQEEKVNTLSAQVDTLEGQVENYKKRVKGKPVSNLSDIIEKEKEKGKSGSNKGNKTNGGTQGNGGVDGKSKSGGTSSTEDDVIKEGDIIKLDKVYFERNSSYLKKESYSQLDKLAEMINASPNMHIKVIGHTDYVASEMYNMWLSERRAKRVADYLVSKGVPEANITSVGFGMKSPVADNATDEGRALNRRVEIDITKK